MDPYKEIELFDCPFCSGPGILEEEGGWCWYVVCADCGAQTAAMTYKTPEERSAAARKVAELWNTRKVMRGGVGN